MFLCHGAKICHDTQAKSILVCANGNKEINGSSTFCTKKTANHLRVVASKYAFCAADADDIVAETFIRVYKNLASFDPKKDGYNWLCKIVQNVAYTFNAEYKKALDNEVPLDDAETENTDRSYERVLDRIDLARALENESEKTKQIVHMRFYDNATEEEIARETGMSTGSISKKIKRILKNLKKMKIFL